MAAVPRFAQGELSMRTRPDQIIDGFDSAYYLITQPDVAAAGVDPQTHFLSNGWKEGRMPDGLFDPQYYLAQNTDVAAAGVNPLLHYLSHGASEGRDPSARFDTTAYLAANADVADAGAGVDTVRLAGKFLDYTITFNGNQVIIDGLEGHDVFTNFERFSFRDFAFDNRTSALVDEFYYYSLNRDVFAAGVDAAEHYAAYGWKEGRNPNPYFDTNYYLAHNPDIAAAGVNPLTHYLNNGWLEGRDPSANFHTSDYLAANPDVAAARINPLLHYLQNGLNEGRSITPNTAPTITSNGGGATASIGVTENTSVVTTVTANDAESGTVLSYSKVGGADAALFNINASTGALTFVTAPNFENPEDSDHNNGYQVIVRASDGSLFDDQTITVTVTDANDAPIITSNGGGATAAINLAENDTAATTVTATDQDGAAPSYSISGGADAARFSINSSSGALAFVAAPNYEIPTDADANNTYEVIVRASDGTLSDDQALTVTVTDANDNSPVFTSGTTATAAENSLAAYTAVATDSDGTAPNRTLSYSRGSSGDNAWFDIYSSSGIVTFNTVPNFDSPTYAGADNVYNITVNVTDGVHPVSRTVAITVTNVNESPVIISDGGGATAGIALAENISAVTTVAATDEDGTPLSYSLNGGSDASKFSINSSTGALSFITAPDREAATDSDLNNTYVVVVRASDGVNTGDQTITVTITDANDNAPIFSSGAAASVAENGTAAYTADATDADATAP